MTLQNKVQQFSQDADKVNAIVHGPASGAGSTVATDGGPVRTFAKIDADLNANGNVATVLAAKVAAEAARDAAALTAKVYASTAAGVAATANGQMFAIVDNAASEIIFYENVAAVATERYRIKTAAFLNLLFDAAQYGASGYAWAVVDSANNIAIGVTASGQVTIGGYADVASAVPGGKIAGQFLQSRADGDGFAFAIADANDNLAFAVLSDGRVWVAGKTVAPQSQVDTLNDLAIGTKAVVTWGDSLTEGSGATGGQTYPAQLAALIGAGANVINEGFGGQNAAQISARQGGNAAMVTVAGNTIPASGPVAVTLDIGLLAYPTSATLSATGYIGGILGVLTKDAANAYTFTRAVDGVATKVAPNTPFVVTKSTRNTAGIDLDQAINILWMGSNDVGLASINTVLTQLDKCIFKLRPNRKRFLILGPINNQVYTAGTQAYVDMRAAIDAIKSKYPRNFIDIQGLLVENFNAGIPQDVTDYGNKVVPSSLRTDNIHLNNAGYAVVAAAVKAFIDSKGWLA